MSRFDDDDEVRVVATRPLAGPGHFIPKLDLQITNDPQVISGEKANALLEVLPHTVLREEDLSFDVDEGEPQDEVEATEAALDLALENDLDIGDVEGTGHEGRVVKSDVQSHLED